MLKLLLIAPISKQTIARTFCVPASPTLASICRKISLVSNQNESYLLVSARVRFTHLTNPVLEAFELREDTCCIWGLFQGDNEDNALHVAVVNFDQGSIYLLPRCIPKLQVHLILS